jgi:signal peptidase II
MLYFPIIKGHFPSWFPVWGNEDFEFFRPIFNLADAAISGGVISIIVFQRKFFIEKNQQKHTEVNHIEEAPIEG